MFWFSFQGNKEKIIKTKNSKIAFLIPFFGKWPNYVNLFLQSCRGHQIFDIIFFSEENPSRHLPENVTYVEMARSNIWKRINQITKLGIYETPGHKLCDFRPFYGLVFEDLLREYEFWGFCDIDIMFGDLGKSFNEQTLDSLDVFSAHAKQFVGHFTFLRNRKDINHLGFEIPAWQKLCLSPIAEHVDEERFSEVFARHPEIRWARPESLDREIEKPLCRHAITFSFAGKVADFVQPIDPVVTWQKGALQMEWKGKRKTELLYVHFMGLKHPWHWPSNVPAGTNHVFSRLGYGRVCSPEDLKALRWQILYTWQCLLLRAKRFGGRVLKLFLPPEKIRALRRAFGV